MSCDYRPWYRPILPGQWSVDNWICMLCSSGSASDCAKVPIIGYGRHRKTRLHGWDWPGWPNTRVRAAKTCTTCSCVITCCHSQQCSVLSVTPLRHQAARQHRADTSTINGLDWTLVTGVSAADRRYSGPLLNSEQVKVNGLQQGLSSMVG